MKCRGLTGLLMLVANLTAVADIRLDAGAVETWADAYFDPRIDAGYFNGASIGVVQDGDIVLLRGYGYEDLANSVPLDPQRTRFRMCSVSKTFAATAILQLRDQGLIASLDDPANKYLKRFQLPPPHGAQVTLRQLMTHSSGMAGHLTPQGTKLDLPVPVAAAEVASLFRENIERPPGAIGQYANLGVALESVIIEDVSGLPMAEYVSRHILKPLGMSDTLMHHSTDVPRRLAQPYGRFPNGELQAIPFYPKHPLTAASGGIISTPQDMLRYASMHADVRAETFADVLSSVSRREMQSVQFRNHPADPGIGLHFYPSVQGREAYVYHGCGLPGTSSQLGVFPGSNAAIVISVLRAGPTPSLGDVIKQIFGVGRLIPSSTDPSEETPPALDPTAPWTAFVEHFAGPRALPTVSPDAEMPASIFDESELSGTYWTERRSMGSVGTFFAAGNVRTVTLLQDGIIGVGNARAQRVAPGVYDTDDGSRYIFRRIAADGPIYLHTGPSNAWRRTGGLGDPVIASTLWSFGALFALTLIAVPLWPRTTTTERLLRANGFVALATLVLTPIAMFAGYDGISDIAYIDAANGDTTRLILVVILMNISSLTGLGFVTGAVLVWRRIDRGWRSMVWRGHITLLALAAIMTWPALVLFNMIGINQ